MRILLNCLLGLAIVLLCRSASAQQNDVADEPPKLAAPEDFVIFPWDVLTPTKQSYERARDCGMNLAGFVRPENLDAVRDAGLKCFVSDPTINVRGAGEDLSDEQIAQRVKDVVARTVKQPAVFGYHVIDEPPVKLVPQVVRWANAFAAAAPDKIAYTNLLPLGGVDRGRGAVDFENYLTSYIDAAKPKAFSFDWYSIFEDGTVRPRYFECLETARKVSLKSGVPFWHVALAIGHLGYAEPTPAIFRFQVFTTLAYGARGMGWFTYTGRDRGNYRSSAIDLEGRKTPTWDMLRDANMRIHRLAPIYTKLKSVNVFHHPLIPQGCRGLEQSRFLSDVRGNGPFVVGEFEDERGRPAVLVVNRDLTHSTTFAVSLKQKSPILRVSSLTGVVRPMGAEDDWLAPGEGVLLLLHEP